MPSIFKKVTFTEIHYLLFPLDCTILQILGGGGGNPIDAPAQCTFDQKLRNKWATWASFSIFIIFWSKSKN